MCHPMNRRSREWGMRALTSDHCAERVTPEPGRIRARVSDEKECATDENGEQKWPRTLATSYKTHEFVDLHLRSHQNCMRMLRPQSWQYTWPKNILQKRSCVGYTPLP